MEKQYLLPSEINLYRIVADEKRIVLCSSMDSLHHQDKIYMIDRYSGTLIQVQEIPSLEHNLGDDKEHQRLQMSLMGTVLTLCYHFRRDYNAIHQLTIDLDNKKIEKDISYPRVSRHSFFKGVLLLDRSSELYLEDYNRVVPNDKMSTRIPHESMNSESDTGDSDEWDNSLN